MFVHPALDAMALGWEIAEPLAYMARLDRRPLPGTAARHIYEPVGKDDSYFPIDVYDAAALAYGNQQAGAAVWPIDAGRARHRWTSMASRPTRSRATGTAATRVVVQFNGDGILDAHYLYRQLDEVKHQYGCFLETYMRDGIPTVVAPGGLTAPCN